MNRFVSREPRNSFLFTNVNKRRFGMGRNMSLSIESEPLDNVQYFNSTLVKLYFAIAPACRAVLCATRYAGFGLTRLTHSCASRNLKMTLESASLFIKQNSRWSLSILSASERRKVDVSGCYICPYVIAPPLRTSCSALFCFIARLCPCLSRPQKPQCGRRASCRLYPVTRTYL